MLSDIRVSRTLTTNVKNFESIKPSVEIKIKDVPVDKIDSVYKEISSILDGLFQLEQANLYIEIKEIRRCGIEEHVKSIVNQDFDKFNKNIRISLNSIQEDLNDNK